MSKVDEVERLMQVASVLQAAEFPVPRLALIEKVPDYRDSRAGDDSVRRMMDRDFDRLRELGFDVLSVGEDGTEGEYTLRAATWRLPVELDDVERGLLVWVMASAGAAVAEEHEGADDLSGLIGTVPRALDVVQAALAASRQLRIVKDGEELVFSPLQLASRNGTWFVLGTYGGSTAVKGTRVDRLEVLGLGDVFRPSVEVRDPGEVLDPTAWHEHEPMDAEIRCRTADLGVVASWFPRAVQEDLPDGTTALRFWVRNREALVSRVLGLAGTAWVVAPAVAVDELRAKVQAVLEVSA